ncbi:hypothetical protein [Streptomyces sp. B15]|uniref:hypothetical protein n=1 Tax=Streptomyces sp. B15 TaxID=1537797 RepID=UPI001B369050|nr:hypothetical protein [Streptomyces sp. B15]MBQ1118969.1 hypothetical protein [Streptomyces sp. B15]
MKEVEEGWRALMGKRTLVLCAALAVAVLTATVWWFRPSSEEVLAVPERVCGGTFFGKKLEPLLRGGKGEMKANVVRKFPGSRKMSDVPVCELSTKGRSVSFRVDYSGFPNDPLAELEKENDFVAEFGPAHGTYDDLNGTVHFGIPCPTAESPDDTLFLNVGASMARDADAAGMAKLAELAGYAARTLAQDVYKCKGADELPEGPVSIRRGEGSR